MYFLRCIVSRLGMTRAFLLVSDQLWFRPGAVQSNLSPRAQKCTSAALPTPNVLPEMFCSDKGSLTKIRRLQQDMISHHFSGRCFLLVRG